MAQSPLEFAAKMDRAATAVRKAPWKAVEAGAKEAKTIALVRGGRFKKRKLGARYDLTGSYAEPSALVKATPLHLWKWKSEGTKPHVITSRYGGGSRKSRQQRVVASGVLAAFTGVSGGGSRGGRRAVMNIPGIGYRRFVRHPGTHGDHSWNEVVHVIIERAPKKIANYWLDEAIHKTLGK